MSPFVIPNSPVYRPRSLFFNKWPFSVQEHDAIFKRYSNQHHSTSHSVSLQRIPRITTDTLPARLFGPDIMYLTTPWKTWLQEWHTPNTQCRTSWALLPPGNSSWVTAWHLSKTMIPFRPPESHRSLGSSWFTKSMWSPCRYMLWVDMVSGPSLAFPHGLALWCPVRWTLSLPSLQLLLTLTLPLFSMTKYSASQNY